MGCEQDLPSGDVLQFDLETRAHLARWICLLRVKMMIFRGYVDYEMVSTFIIKTGFQWYVIRSFRPNVSLSMSENMETQTGQFPC